MNLDRRRLQAAGRALGAGLVAVVAALIAAQVAVAAPTVTMSARAAAIPKHLLEPTTSPKWPHTGNVAGAGAELEASFTIKGSEDAGLPSPLRRVTISLPKGVTIHKSGFGTCKPASVNWFHTGKAPPCPTDSFAGAVTEQFTRSNLAGTDLPYAIRQGAYFPKSGGLDFWVLGIGGWLWAEGLNRAELRRTSGAYGYKLSERFPRLQAAETGPDLSTEALTVALGAAYQQGGKLISYVTMPKLCPAGGLAVKATLSFGQGAEPSWETVTTDAKLPCRR